MLRHDARRTDKLFIMQADTAMAEAGTVGFQTLEQAFRWATRRIERLMPGEVVIQDEYTHDVIFLALDGSALVFDTT
jgi:hypothetical protein